MRQSPQICFAFHCHASTRSEAGTSSVENSCDIVSPSTPSCRGRLVGDRTATWTTKPQVPGRWLADLPWRWRRNVTQKLTGRNINLASKSLQWELWRARPPSHLPEERYGRSVVSSHRHCCSSEKHGAEGLRDDKRPDARRQTNETIALACDTAVRAGIDCSRGQGRWKSAGRINSSAGRLRSHARCVLPPRSTITSPRTGRTCAFSGIGVLFSATNSCASGRTHGRWRTVNPWNCCWTPAFRPAAWFLGSWNADRHLQKPRSLLH